MNGIQFIFTVNQDAAIEDRLDPFVFSLVNEHDALAIHEPLFDFFRDQRTT